MDYKTIDNLMGDATDALVQTALEQVPVVSFFVSAVDKVRSASLQRKYESWQEMVSVRLSSLEETIFNNLGDNDTFATVLLKTTELASQSNQKKMELLANFVRYTAENEVSDDYLIMFLNDISKYTITHIVVLKYFQAPIKTEKNVNILSSSPLSLFTEHYPKINRPLVNIVTKELYSDGLLAVDNLGGSMTKDGCFAKRTTEMGDKFIEYFGIKDFSNE